MNMSTANMNRNSVHCAVGIEKILMGWQSVHACGTLLVPEVCMPVQQYLYLKCACLCNITCT